MLELIVGVLVECVMLILIISITDIVKNQSKTLRDEKRIRRQRLETEKELKKLK